MRVAPSACRWLAALFLLVALAGCNASERMGAPSAGPGGAVAHAPVSGSRHWLGPGYWGNRLQDWRFEDGRIVCVTPQGWLPMRTVHDLTRQVTRADVSFEMSVELSLRPAGGAGAYPSDAGAGVLVGVGNGEMDYRSAALVHHWQGKGAGLFAGIDGLGQAFIVDNEQPWTIGGAFDASQALPRSKWAVSADSEEPGNPAANAIDGRPGTIWHTEFTDSRPEHPHELVIELGEPQTFAALAYLPRQDNNSGHVGAFEVYAAKVRGEWGQPIATGTLPDSADLQVIELPKTTAKYLKLVARSAQRDQPATSVAEVYLLKELIVPGDEPEGVLPPRVRLVLRGEPLGPASYGLVLEARDAATDTLISSAAKVIGPARVLGNVALVSHPGTQADDASPARFAFEDWSVAGPALSSKPDQQLGPILGTQYTLSRGVLKMSAQFMPLGRGDRRLAQLQVQRNGRWIDAARVEIPAPSHCAVFRLEGWDDTRDTPYRVVYELGGRNRGVYQWSGTIRKDPKDKPQITVAGMTCTVQAPWGARTNWIDEVFFPHADLTTRVAAHRPDLLFFAGDQIYEGSPTFSDAQNLELDYQYKWAMYHWAFRELTRDTPTVTLPDDHDVYQPNLWGEGGRKAPGADNTGGYTRPADFVTMVHRTQTAHLPDPHDDTPIGQGIPVYHTDLLWGRVSFAILADRMFKTGPGGDDRLPPSGTGRPDHYNNPDFDTADLDLPDLTLLGDRQLAFLDHWARDWQGADMKMALSQTVFANMATHHGPELTYLMADLDSNGWPQTGRNKAVAALRRAFAMHLCGDQHLAMLMQHGIDEHQDAVWSFCVPSVSNAYPRAWAPGIQGPYTDPQPEQVLGDRLDGFKNKVTVYAAANPGRESGHTPAILHDKMPGYGIVVIDKTQRTYEAQCWPRYADPVDPSQQYPGWPRTIDQLDNGNREPAGYLPELVAEGLDNFVVQVTHQTTGELVYALRVNANRFRPAVFEPGTYDVRVTEPDQPNRNNDWTFTGLGIGDYDMPIVITAE